MIGIVILNYRNWEDTKRCVKSIEQNPPKDAYKIILVDNASENRPAFNLSSFVERYAILLIQNQKNTGYNAGNNKGIAKAQEIGCNEILISNNDVRYFPHAIDAMQECLRRCPSAGIAAPMILDAKGKIQKGCMFRRTGMAEKYKVRTRAHILFRNSFRTYFGYDKDYASRFEAYAVPGCCFMMTARCARAVTPFDEHPFLYEEEFILGIQMEEQGFRSIYEPKAVIEHLHGRSTRHRKAFSFAQNVRSEIYYCKHYLHAANREIYPLYLYRVLLYLIRCMQSRDFRKNWTWFWNMTRKELKLHWNTAANAEKDGYADRYPLVSVIVRTCSRPGILRTALESIQNQTYPNIEVVIVEDGKNTAEEMVRTEYPGLRYVYEATGRRIGRSGTGNRAMELSSGKYLNFLDDDDILFPNHIEILVKHLKGRKEKAVYSVAKEGRAIRCQGKSIQLPVGKKQVRFRQPFHRLLLYTQNYIPIQSILFERSLFEKMGGLDENLEALEDWDLWIRYSQMTDFLFVNQVTSCYYVPWLKRKQKERAEQLRKNLVKLHKKWRMYQIDFSVEEINREMMYVIRQYKEQRIVRYVRMAVRVLLLGER